jgi:hypothetical protein
VLAGENLVSELRRHKGPQRTVAAAILGPLLRNLAVVYAGVFEKVGQSAPPDFFYLGVQALHFIFATQRLNH